MSIRDERKQQSRQALLDAALKLSTSGRSFSTISLREIDLLSQATVGEVSLSDLACVQNPTARAISDLPDQNAIQKAWFHDQLFKVAEKYT